MSKDVAERLDALAHDYRDGRLTLEAYRNLRAPLLDLLTSQPSAEIVDQSLTTQRDRVARGRSAKREDSPAHAARPSRRGLRVVGRLASAAIVVIAALTLYPWAPDVHAPAPASQAQFETAREPTQTLGDSDDWSGARMHSLLEEFDSRALCRKELAGSPEPFCRDLLATAEAGPQLLVVTAEKAAGGVRRSFAISLYEVSQAQFRRYCEQTANRCPLQLQLQDNDSMVNVTWDEARQYLLWLSEMSGQTYRLPTEAEWQQASRDGKKSGWRAGRAREWTQDQGSPTPSSKTVRADLKSFRAVRELQ